MADIPVRVYVLELDPLGAPRPGRVIGVYATLRDAQRQGSAYHGNGWWCEGFGWEHHHADRPVAEGVREEWSHGEWSHGEWEPAFCRLQIVAYELGRTYDV